MQLKYHRQINFEHEKLLELFILTVNRKFKRLSVHAKERILERFSDNIENIGKFIREYNIQYDDIIEYTFLNGNVQKILIRRNFNDNKDIVLSIASTGTIVTCYLNNKLDNHYTLNKKEYARA